jgi:hypothetical protein
VSRRTSACQVRVKLERRDASWARRVVPPPDRNALRSHRLSAHAEEFVAVRLAIINATTASAGDRLRAMEQLESRALGKPKETVETKERSPVDDALTV